MLAERQGYVDTLGDVSLTEGVRDRLGTELFRKVAGPDGPKRREFVHGSPGARWFEPDAVRAGLACDWRDAEAEGEGIVLSTPISIARWLAERWLAEVTGTARGRG